MTTIVVRFVGKSVSPKTISGALGGQPHESCLWGDMIDVAEDDDTVSRKRSLSGFWRRTVEVDRYASVSVSV
jgi:hypothetical protein